MAANVNFHYLLKYIIIGDASVGKSNILLKYAHNQFKAEYQLTIGVEFGAKNIKIKDKIYRIQIWDTAGQENFRSITRAYYKNSVCALVVYDITNRQSFENVKAWIEDCKSQSPSTILMALVGNKIDLDSSRAVSTEEGEDFANMNGMPFFETSAKSGENIDSIFTNTATEICHKIEEGCYDVTNDSCGIKVGINESRKTVSGMMSNVIQNDEGKKCCK